MAITIIDDFNSYSDGNLNGQGGWSGDASFKVQGTTVQEGAKAIACGSGTNDVLIKKSITARTSGIFSVYLRADWRGIYNTIFQLLDGSTPKVMIYLNTNYNEDTKVLAFGGGGGAVLANNYASGVYCKFDIEIDQSNNRIRGRMNNGTWSSWISCSFSKIDYVLIGKASNGNTTNSYYDYITYDDGKTDTSQFFNFF